MPIFEFCVGFENGCTHCLSDDIFKVVTHRISSRYAAIYGVNVDEKMRTKSFVLMNQHPHEDIRFQAKKMFDAIQVPLS
jgi:hypothetical protein